MVVASVAVDPFNPGQVFACLGFIEAADVLIGEAEGGFDWSEKAAMRFVLRAAGDENPFAVVLRFLAEAEVRRRGPIGYADPPPKGKKASAEDEAGGGSEDNHDLTLSESFPNREADRMTLPIRLDASGRSIDLGHWADGSSRNDFKLYSGNRSGASIARAMLRGTRKKPRKGQSVGDIETRGMDALWGDFQDALTAAPFDLLTPMGGSFNLDPRGGWTPLDAGYSPDQQNDGIEASPVVELLGALGLEHARPDEYETREVRYAAWSGLVPPMMARAAMAGASVGIAVRTFRFRLDLSGKNKVVTFAEEEINK